MGVETRYDYIYYTAITSDWLEFITSTLESELTSEILCDVINKKLKESNDWTLNNLKVDYSQHCDDIDDWIRIHNRHKDRPVFVQLGDEHPVITTGQGSLFVLYEEDDDDPNESITVRYGSRPDSATNNSFIPYHGTVDGLAGAGGRL